MENSVPEKKNSNLLYDVHESPKKISEWIVLAIQHILAMFVACITVPLVAYGKYSLADGTPLAQAMIAPTLISAGVGTIFYLVVTKFKSPVVLASSFAYMPTMMLAVSIGATTTMGPDGVTPILIANLWSLPIGMLMVGIVYVVIAIVIKYVGVAWLNKLLPPIIIGPVIAVIGLSLAGSAVNNLCNIAVSKDNYNLIHIVCGLVAMFATALSAHYGKKMVSLIPFVIGVAAGYVTAVIFTLIGYYGAGSDYFQVVDFSPIVNNFEHIGVESFISLPHFVFLGKDTVDFDWASLGQIALLFIPVSLVTICEHIGDHENLSGILDRNLLEEPGLSRTLIGDGVATAISGILCGAANTTYGENVAVVGVTKVASTKVILLAAGMTILLGFLSPIMCVVQTLPACVTGGVSLLLYGFIASSGIKIMIKEKIDFGKTKNIFVASAILVAGIGGLAIEFMVGGADGTSIKITSIAIAIILGIVMNLILKDTPAASEEAK